MSKCKYIPLLIVFILVFCATLVACGKKKDANKDSSNDTATIEIENGADEDASDKNASDEQSATNSDSDSNNTGTLTADDDKDSQEPTFDVNDL